MSLGDEGAQPAAEPPDLAVARMRAVAHPVRLDLLSLLTGASLSASEVARELQITQANASYHLRRLLDAGLLVLDGEEKVNGGTAKKYRHPWRELRDQEREEASGTPYDVAEADRVAQVTTLAEAVPRRFARCRPGGGDRLLADIETWVDPDVWARAVALVSHASDLLHTHASAPRAPGTVPASLSVAAFLLEDPS